ncbi:MAG TPA: patatin-like phospholipase family protein [Acidimicrobiales bacterium]|nr:patatin-like phospholipase family protein [Acidimicrobiales bacterium]
MTKALVLSGGGSLGIAWQVGLAAGLAEAGVDLREADLVVGTSAGSAVGARIALGWDMADQLGRYRKAGTDGAGEAGRRIGAGGGAAERMQKLMELMAEAQSSDASPEETRAAIGRFALEADAGPEDRFVDSFAYLAGEGWPEGYVCTAVNAVTGEFTAWDGSRGEPLERAVASSCSVPGLFPPITVNGERYIDGGMRSGTNADLAKGHDRVLIVTLMGGTRQAAPGGDERMARYLARFDSEMAVLAEAGGKVETVGPDEGAAAVLGVNLMDAARGPEAAEAGYAQGRREAGRVGAFWATS